VGDRRKRSKREREDRREELIDAAVAAIRRDGAEVSMEEIAQEAGITKPIIYANFGDKAGLADAIAGRFAAELQSEFATVWSQTDDPRERVVRSIDAWVGFIERDPHIYSFLSEGSFGAGRRLDERRLVDELGRTVSRALGEALRASGADSGPAEPWAFGILGMIHVSTEWWLERRTLSRADFVQFITDLLWRGLSGGGLDTGRPDPPVEASAEADAPVSPGGVRRPTAATPPPRRARRR
jgi:AcrR family transcriptional regulator